MTHKELHIPEKYPEFDIKTLIICVSHNTAKVYLVDKRNMKELPEVHTAETDYHYSDKEGFSAGHGGTTTGTDHHNKEHYERVFLNFLVGELKKMESEHHIERMFVFVPEDIKNITREKFSDQMQKKTEFLHGNLLKTHPLDLIDRISIF